MAILAIESSCDETGLAIYDEKAGRLIAHRLYSQIALHAKFGGVVPELASRDHIRKILPLTKEVLRDAEVDFKDLTGVAYTAGPGLIGALMVGASFAVALGYALKIPVIPVNHLEGHLLASFLEEDQPEFPFLGLLVSGGHSQLVQCESFGNYQLLGETLDDAVGEAFDKVAKILGLPYPGGPLLAKLAKTGAKTRFHFPRPLADRPELNFSFSGLKTCALNAYLQHQNEENVTAHIAAAFEDAATDSLLIKCKQALQRYPLKTLVVAGGVSANQVLRAKLNGLGKELGIKVYWPRLEFCTDNGAMIAYVGAQKFLRGEIATNYQIDINPRLNWL